MTKRADNNELTSRLKNQFSHIESDESELKNSRENIADIVMKIETLYNKIDQEITERSAVAGASNDLQIEKWSEEIEYLCQKIEVAPIQNSLDLRAKISLHLSLISKSFLDRRSIEIHSNSIMDILEEYECICTTSELRLVQ